MIAVSAVCMHCACHHGSGMFARLVRLLMRILMGVSVIHVVLVFRRHVGCLRGCHAEIIQVWLPHRRRSWRHRTSISFASHRHHYFGHALPSYINVIGFSPGT
jgi:hypothetical protein